MNNDKTSTNVGSNILSQTFSAYKPISSQHMTIDVKSLNASRDGKILMKNGVKTQKPSKSSHNHKAGFIS